MIYTRSGAGWFKASGAREGWGDDRARSEAWVLSNVVKQSVPRIGRVEDIADAVVYLASPRADFINGAHLSTAEQNPATRRRKSRPLGGASGERREGVARPEFPACGVGDYGGGFSLPFVRGFVRAGGVRT